MNTKTVVRLAALLAIGAVAYYFVTGSVQKDMSEKQRSMERAIVNSSKDIPTVP